MARRSDIIDVGFRAKEGEKTETQAQQVVPQCRTKQIFCLVQGRATRERPQRRRALNYFTPLNYTKYLVLCGTLDHSVLWLGCFFSALARRFYIFFIPVGLYLHPVCPWRTVVFIFHTFTALFYFAPGADISRSGHTIEHLNNDTFTNDNPAFLPCALLV